MCFCVIAAGWLVCEGPGFWAGAGIPRRQPGSPAAGRQQGHRRHASQFTPPEAIENPAQVDPRSDLYAVGALAYFLLTQHYIFDAETVEEIHQKQLAAEPIHPACERWCPSAPSWKKSFWTATAKGSRQASAIGKCLAGIIAGLCGGGGLDAGGESGLVDDLPAAGGGQPSQWRRGIVHADGDGTDRSGEPGGVGDFLDRMTEFTELK